MVLVEGDGSPTEALGQCPLWLPVSNLYQAYLWKPHHPRLVPARVRATQILANPYINLANWLTQFEFLEKLLREKAELSGELLTASSVAVVEGESTTTTTSPPPPPRHNPYHPRTRTTPAPSPQSPIPPSDRAENDHLQNSCAHKAAQKTHPIYATIDCQANDLDGARVWKQFHANSGHCFLRWRATRWRREYYVVASPESSESGIIDQRHMGVGGYVTPGRE